jgi:hypothetical protein
MDKYIKVSDLIDLINKHKNEINKDFEQGKVSMSSHIAMVGVLEVLKKDVNK